MQNFFETKPNQLLISLVLLMAVVALGAYAYLAFKQAENLWGGPTTITVSGEGEMVAVPDVGQFSFAVEAKGDDAATAQSVSAEQINEILTYLIGEGVEEKDIKTESYNLFPRYRYEERICPVGSFCPSGDPIMDGFTVSQSIQVKVRDLTEAGALIAGVGERGATNLRGLNFAVDDTSKMEADAQALAIADAQAKAVVLAQALGVRIERMTGFYAEENGPMPYGGVRDEMMLEAKSVMVAPEVPAGEQKMIKRVNVTFAVK